MKLFEDKPRWPGAPMVCLAANLPAFETRKAAMAYMEKYCPRMPVALKECDACGCFHNQPKPTPKVSGKYGTH
jgi:hypothetical protein